MTNTVITTFRAVGGNVVSELNSYAAGFGRLGSSINDNVNMSSRLNNQWRAIGTTIRYAVAGTAVFGLTRMVGQLRDVNNQLALMSAIGSGPSGQPFSFNQITQLGTSLQDAAVNSITPVNEMNDATINFLSTVQNVPRTQIPTIMEDIAKGARLAQTPVEDLTQAATTMNIAFGRANNIGNISSFTRMWYALISTAPGGITAAPTIAQSLPGLASMFQLAPGHTPGNVGQAQMMGLTLGVLRTGMPPATALRGLTYLLQSIAQPTGGAKQALSGIGITPQYIQRHGVYAGVMRLLHTIRPASARTAQRLGVMDETALPDVASTDVASLPGISGNEMTRLRAMIPRIHGIRAAIILSSQLQARGSVSSLAQDVADMTAAEQNHAKAAQDMNKAWQRAQQRMKLQQATVAINQMGLQVAQMFEPVLNFAAGGPLNLSHFMRTHRHESQTIGRVMVGAIAGAGAARMLGVRIPGLGFMRGAGTRITQLNAERAALTGNPGILGATPQNPLYVTVVGQLFGGSTPTPSPSPGGGGSWFSKITGAMGLSSVARAVLPKFAGAVGAFGAEIPGISDWRMWMPGAWNPAAKHTNAGWENFLTLGLANRGHPGTLAQLSRAQQLFPRRGISGLESFVRGQADVNLIVDVTDPTTGRKSRQRVHVPIDLWSGGRTPSHRGQHKTVRTK